MFTLFTVSRGQYSSWPPCREANDVNQAKVTSPRAFTMVTTEAQVTSMYWYLGISLEVDPRFARA